jgi:hypothetical protein
VGVSLTVPGADPGALSELARAAGGALAVARVKAGVDGNTDLARFLDFAKVVDQGGSFSVELALPLSFLVEQLAQCDRSRPAGASGSGVR